MTDISLFDEVVLEKLNRKNRTEVDTVGHEAYSKAYEAYISTFDAARVEVVRSFVESLSSYRSGASFNPWGDVDLRLDATDEAAEIRKRNLTAYLLPRLGTARIFAVAEAVGYQGGRFSGIAITCERMLLHHHSSISADLIAPIPLQRTSSGCSALLKAVQREKGLNEPTDTVVWNAIVENGIDPYETLLWNLFPFHPHKPGEPLTNRTPSEEEQIDGWQYTKGLLDLHAELGGPDPLLLAVGRKSADMWGRFGIGAIALRHPANGGANLYRQGFSEAVKTYLET